MRAALAPMAVRRVVVGYTRRPRWPAFRTLPPSKPASNISVHCEAATPRAADARDGTLGVVSLHALYLSAAQLLSGAHNAALGDNL